ncbi:MAG: DUF3883 domain-containing protein [Gemmatimonadaceae bacterium]|nr:DUF3883 domain-containing protein [Gemmatimonadaceae bacterium]
MSLLYYESIFSQLNLHRAGGHTSPHKVAMLLAVMDLVEDGTLTENMIKYSKALTRAFARRFKELQSAGDRARAIYPYFHLRKDRFWHHNLKPGRSEAYARLSTVTTRSQIDDNVAFVSLDQELFELLGNSDVRQLLRDALRDNLTITEEERRARLEVGGWDWLDGSIPERLPIVASPRREYVARHINHSLREAENRKLGESGERFVLHFERFCLTRAGREDLANEVEWTSKERGDGLGYDVRSFQIGDDGLARDQELFIEVKTTNQGRYQPFYISENEVQFSRETQDRYGLYRVYDFYSESPRLYRIHGHVESHLRLNPVLYRADFGYTPEGLGQ